MTIHLGFVPAGQVLYIPFHTFNSGGASVTITGLAVTDIEVYKNGSATQRASDAGYALLDTDGIDFDGLTGIHGFSIDTGDNTDAGFYSVGGMFWVVVSAITVDGQTVSFVAATFFLGPQQADVRQYGGTAGTFAGGRPEVNTTHVAGTSQTAGDIIGDTNDIQSRLPAALVSGRIDASVGAMAANVMTAAAAAADLTTELQTGLATASALATLDGKVDTVDANVDAILVDTAEIGLAGAGLTALASAANLSAVLADTNELQTDWADGGRLDLILDSRASQASVNSLPTAAGIADAVWEEAIVDHSGTAGSTAEALAAAGSAGDPWITALPGAYTAGQAGKIVGDFLDASVSSRATQTSVDDLPTNAELATALDPLPTAAENATAVWGAAARTLTALDEDTTTLDLDATIRGAVGLASANLDTQIDALPTAAENADAVWDEALSISSHATPGSAGYNMQIAGQILVDTTATGAPSTTQVQLTAGSAVDDFYNDQLLYIADGTGLGQVRPILDYVGATRTVTVSEPFVVTPASGDRLIIQTAHVHPNSQVADAVWTNASRTLTALDEDATTMDLDATIRGAVGLAAANLDTQIDALPTAAENAAATWGAGARTLTALDEDSTTIDLDATVRTAVGLASANLDTQLSEIDLRGERTVVRGTAAGGASTTSIPTSAFSPAGAAADQFKGRIVVFDNDTATAALRGQATDITASSNSATPTLTVTALTTAPASGDTFSVL